MKKVLDIIVATILMLVLAFVDYNITTAEAGPLVEILFAVAYVSGLLAIVTSLIRLTMPKKTKLYNLCYYIGSRLAETPVLNSTKAICNWKKNQLKETTHKLGTFKVIQVKDYTKA